MSPDTAAVLAALTAFLLAVLRILVALSRPQATSKEESPSETAP